MKTQEFDYVLPDDRIAAYPLERRDGSRLLRLDRASGHTKHLIFDEIGRHLSPKSLLVLNDTRVIPARLRGRRPTGGGIELLLIRRVNESLAAADSDAGAPLASEAWEAIGRNLGNVTPGTRLSLGFETDRPLDAEVIEHGEDGFVRVRLHPSRGESVAQAIERIGEMPVPPYILAARKRGRGDGVPASGSGREGGARELGVDGDRYQTVYAAHAGAVAAPTAGLHFTVELLDELRATGHQIATLTLHVGPGTFRSVAVDDVEDHPMDAEWYSIPPETAAAVDSARRAGRSVTAVGTTVVRALESAARAGSGAVRAGTASSRLFLRPGDGFEVVTDLVTNFHLPRSTLLMLVCAFAGRDHVLAAYAEAIARGYRFYSYGDAMLIRGTS